MSRSKHTETCSVIGCERSFYAKDFCYAHWERWRAHGDPQADLPLKAQYQFPENLARRLLFCPPTTMPTGCIEYTGSRSRGGYGTVSVGGGTNRPAHRASYELVRGPIPDGLQLDHLCRNRICVNPAHLEPVTQRENLMRGEGPSAVHARQTHCVNGHEFTPENTYYDAKRNRRTCRACSRERQRRRRS